MQPCLAGRGGNSSRWVRMGQARLKSGRIKFGSFFWAKKITAQPGPKSGQARPKCLIKKKK